MMLVLSLPSDKELSDSLEEDEDEDEEEHGDSESLEAEAEEEDQVVAVSSISGPVSLSLMPAFCAVFWFAIFSSNSFFFFLFFFLFLSLLFSFFDLSVATFNIKCNEACRIGACGTVFPAACPAPRLPVRRLIRCP